MNQNRIKEFNVSMLLKFTANEILKHFILNSVHDIKVIGFLDICFRGSFTVCSPDGCIYEYTFCSFEYGCNICFKILAW